MNKYLVFSGGYTEDAHMASGEVVPGRCRGLSCLSLDMKDGALTPTSLSGVGPNPSYVVLHPTGPWVYCVNELKDYGGVPGATVSAFEMDPSDGSLRFLSRQFSGGADPCFLAFSPDGGHLLAANYSGSSVGVLPIGSDGSLKPLSCLLTFQGTGADASRQEAPHPHQILIAPDGQHVYVSDLGTDTLRCLRADWSLGWLQACPELDIHGLPGQGLRHGAFNAAGDRLYVITELTAEVNVYDYKIGRSTLIQTVSALSGDKTVPHLGAAIRLHPNGRHLYVSVRGTDHLAVFPIEEDGRLSPARIFPSGGQIPRDFILTPDGRFLLVSHQDSHTICVHAVDCETGALALLRTQPDIGSATTVALRQ